MTVPSQNCSSKDSVLCCLFRRSCLPLSVPPTPAQCAFKCQTDRPKRYAPRLKSTCPICFHIHIDKVVRNHEKPNARALVRLFPLHLSSPTIDFQRDTLTRLIRQNKRSTSCFIGLSDVSFQAAWAVFGPASTSLHLLLADRLARLQQGEMKAKQELAERCVRSGCRSGSVPPLSLRHAYWCSMKKGESRVPRLRLLFIINEHHARPNASSQLANAFTHR